MKPAGIGMSFCMLLALGALDAASAASLLRGGLGKPHHRTPDHNKHLPQHHHHHHHGTPEQNDKRLPQHPHQRTLHQSERLPQQKDLMALEHMVLDMRKLDPDAQADIQNLLNGFEEAINSSHTAAQTMLDNFGESFTNCSTDRGTGSTAANALAGTSGTLKGNHENCRKTEATKYQALTTCNSTVQSLKTIKDGSCKEASDATKTPSINLVPKPEANEDYAAWLERVRSWAVSELANLNGKQAACDTATTNYAGNHSACLGTDSAGSTVNVYEAEKATCNRLQDNFEAAVCTHAEKVEDVCEDYNTCYSAAKNSYDADLPNINTAQTSRTNEWWMIQRIKCYFNVMVEAGTGNVDEAAMNACKTTSHDAPHLILKTPTVGAPPEDDCSVTNTPCSSEFLNNEYGHLSSDAPAKTCTPCDGGAGSNAF